MPLSLSPSSSPDQITSQQLMEDYFGTKNVADWSDMDNTGTPEAIARGAQAGVDAADAFNNRVARESGYATFPIPTDLDDYAYLQIECTKLAMAETYFRPGRDKTSDQFGQMETMREEAKAAIKEFWSDDDDESTSTIGTMDITFTDETPVSDEFSG